MYVCVAYAYDAHREQKRVSVPSGTWVPDASELYVAAGNHVHAENEIWMVWRRRPLPQRHLSSPVLLLLKEGVSI